MRFLPRRLTGPVWDCPSAVPSLRRITDACRPPTTLHAAQVFTSFYLPAPKHMNDAHRALPRCSLLMTMTPCPPRRKSLSRFHQTLKPAIDHALGVERQRLGVHHAGQPLV